MVGRCAFVRSRVPDPWEVRIRTTAHFPIPGRCVFVRPRSSRCLGGAHSYDRAVSDAWEARIRTAAWFRTHGVSAGQTLTRGAGLVLYCRHGNRWGVTARLQLESRRAPPPPRVARPACRAG